MILPLSIHYSLRDPRTRNEIKVFVVALLLSGILLSACGFVLYQKVAEAPKESPTFIEPSAVAMRTSVN